MNKKGVSGVVTVLIIVALSLVAIGIVWKVIWPMFTSGTQNINYSSKCLEVNLKPTSLACEDTVPSDGDGNYECDVNLKRDTSTGDAEFDGVIAIFSDADDEQKVYFNTGNIELLETDSIETTNADKMTIDATKVKIGVYFTKEDGTKYICPGTNEFKLS